MASPLEKFIMGQQAGQQLQARKFDLQQAQQQAPLRNESAGLAVAQQRQQVAQGAQGQEMAKMQFINKAFKAIKQAPPEQRQSIIQQLQPTSEQFGASLADFPNDIMNDQVIDGVIMSSERFASDPRALSAGMAEFEQMTSGLSPEDKALAIRQRLNLDARPLSLTPEEIEKRELAKLQGQRSGDKAGLAGDVTTAQEQAKAEVKREGEAIESKKTYKVFNIAMDNLSTSLGGTSLTGPIAGRLPASTTAAQIAESAKAIMLPTLKQIFRSAGEGTFTDSDQRALEALIPNRTQSKEAQLATIEAIEKIVKAKLGVDDEPEEQEQPKQNNDQLMQDAQAAIAAGADPSAVEARLKQLLGGQ